METMHKLKGFPLRRAHFVGTSVVVTIDPTHVRRLEIDDMTFFIQRPAKNGILLELRKFEGSTHDKEQKDSLYSD